MALDELTAEQLWAMNNGFGGVNSASILPPDLQKQLATAVNTNYRAGPYTNSNTASYNAQQAADDMGVMNLPVVKDTATVSGREEPGVISDAYNTFMGKNFDIGNYGGLGNYGTYNGVGLSKDAFNAVQGTEHGGDLQKNDSNNTLGYVNAGIQGIGTLGNLYFAKKNADLQEDFTNWQKGKVAESDARKRQFAKNVGGTY